MPSRRLIQGKMRQGERPDWGPLELVGAELLDMFMWMYDVECDDGRLLQAYKHICTRRYAHLDAAGGAYAYVAPNRYRAVALADALEEALAPWWEYLDATPAETAACRAVIERARLRSRESA
jgi:hypothetical protein